MPDVGFTHVALAVRDLEASIDFYARYAGMQVVHRRSGVVWLSDKSRPFVLVLLEDAAAGTPLGPLSHIGIACATRREMDRLCAQARDEGCFQSGPADSGGPAGYWAFLRDPDGHVVELSYGQEVGAAVERSARGRRWTKGTE